MAEMNGKVEIEDVPKILAAIKNGIESKKKWTLTVKGADNGGIIDIYLVLEKSYK